MKISHELNPKNDLSRVINAKSASKYMNSRFLNSAKSALRGVIIGGLAGLLLGNLLDKDIPTYISGCAKIGMLLDIAQYNLRHSIYTFRHLNWYRSLPYKD